MRSITAIYGRLIGMIVLLGMFAFGSTRCVFAQTPPATDEPAASTPSGADVSKQVANPLSNLWLMQVQQNNNWIGMPSGGVDRVQSDLQFQPFLPLKLNDDWNFITRPVLQVFNSTPFRNDADHENRNTGFGDTVMAFAVSPGPRLAGHWLLAAGPTFIFPTATSLLLG